MLSHMILVENRDAVTEDPSSRVQCRPMNEQDKDFDCSRDFFAPGQTQG